MFFGGEQIKSYQQPSVFLDRPNYHHLKASLTSRPWLTSPKLTGTGFRPSRATWRANEGQEQLPTPWESQTASPEVNVKTRGDWEKKAANPILLSTERWCLDPSWSWFTSLCNACKTYWDDHNPMKLSSIHLFVLKTQIPFWGWWWAIRILEALSYIKPTPWDLNVVDLQPCFSSLFAEGTEIPGFSNVFTVKKNMGVKQKLLSRIILVFCHSRHVPSFSYQTCFKWIALLKRVDSSLWKFSKFCRFQLRFRGVFVNDRTIRSCYQVSITEELTHLKKVIYNSVYIYIIYIYIYIYMHMGVSKK